MRKFTAFTVLALVSCACSGSAQTKKAPAVEPAGDITIIGCVEPTDKSTPAGRTADTKYMLTNAKESNRSGATAGTTGAAGTTGTAGSSATGTSYQLDASDATIQPEVGHVVEIVAAAPEPDPSGKTTKLKVQTIKFVAAACPPK
jgi:hypothetical protein